MKRVRLGVALMVAMMAAGAASAQGTAHLDSVLAKMDAASLRFQSAEADLHKDLYERVTKETTTQVGSMYFLRKGSTTQTGAKFSAPAQRVIEVKDGVMQLFDVTPDHLTLISIKGNQALYDTFFTLGFGGSGKDLAKAWEIADEGTEQMNDGKQTVSVEKLDLVSKDPGSRSTFTHVTIWIDPVRGIALKQQFFTPSGDIQTATYTNIRYNEKIDFGAFAIKTDKKTTRDDRR